MDTAVPQATDAEMTRPPTQGLKGRVKRGLDAAVGKLLSLQHGDGHWCAELEGDSILQSEYILMKWILGQEDDPRLPQITAYLRRQQRADGTWGQYPGSKIDISATVKGYFCLKLAGDDVRAPHMARAREAILAAGGAERCNTFSKFYLACLGQVPYSAIPSIPPEIMKLPRWFYFHIDKVASWTRAMIITLSLVVTHRPVRAVPERLGIDELYRSERDRNRLLPTVLDPHPFWTPVFGLIDRGLKLVDLMGGTPWRASSVRAMERWVLERLEQSDGLGAIFPPMVYLQVAFQLVLGYDEDHPVLVEARRQLDRFMLKDPETGEIRLQPCFSPVWDTGIAAYALTEAGLDQGHEGMGRAADWLVAKEVTIKGDWANNLPEDVPPAGWFFEYENAWYPDCDDTVMVAMALRRIGRRDGIDAANRGIDWVLAMQNPDGGWAAFDRGACNRSILEYVPFADHNAMQDPSCPDITGRVLECLGHHGFRADHPAVLRAIAYIKTRQEPDGPFFGRWGVNYIYGTWQSIGGLDRLGYDMTLPWIRKAGEWLKSVQQSDGSFGESADTYEDPSLRGRGPSTASQTAWGMMTLQAIYGPEDDAVKAAARWLIETQQSDGDWVENEFTGTGFPRVFYLRYHLYRLYFPVMALGRWHAALG
ncbi:squalene--hopene cyclase [Mucisphaera calidilacus]|uniref:Squalene--hopene cyclase n=1 Tax=Mucisphaera calidilacus TaxID=2527982 RepID=A0A518BWK3_9BACT|nr:squalene--hopene cyclase [Mucisphaera calidilacus]QDU71363.1 Squalene--hopene cyclase [Mucisphaera calidilacus]